MPITGTCPVPDERWQSRQWQSTANSGFPETSYRTAPHRQPPVIIFHPPASRPTIAESKEDAELQPLRSAAALKNAAARSRMKPAVSVERLNQLKKSSVRILEAKEFCPRLAAKPYRDRLGYHRHAI